MKHLALLLTALLPFFLTSATPTQDPAPTRLCVVWSSGDSDVAKNVCFMYTHAANKAGWFDEVHLVVWGPSAKLLAESPDLQVEIKAMQKSGVVTEACVVCAKRYNVDKKLADLGITVKPMGRPLTDRLQSDWKTITF